MILPDTNLDIPLLDHPVLIDQSSVSYPRSSRTILIMRGRIDRGASSAGDIVTGTVFTGIFGTAAGVLAAGHPVWAGFEAGVATVAAGFTGWEVARVARAKRRGDREVH